MHLPLTNKYEARMMSFAITDGFSCVIESYLLEALLGRHLKVFLSMLICFFFGFCYSMSKCRI